VDIDVNLSKVVKRALGLLSWDEYYAAKAILPIFQWLKDGCHGFSGCNMIQHPPPTIDEGVSWIEQSTLKPQHKTTLVAIIRANPHSSRGDALFLPLNSLTEVRVIEEQIHQVREQLEGLKT